MFHVKLVARPDARMMEVPLEIEAELPREFDGAALLASSGLPRKVKIKSPKDTLKLSTAYRADQLLGEVVRTAMRGTPQDVTRVQEAAAAFVKRVRERRQDGASFTVTSNGRGKIDVSEGLPSKPAPAAAQAPGAAAAPPAPSAGTGSLADRMNALERRLGQLDGSGSGELEARLQQGQLNLQQRLTDAVAAMEARLVKIEERLTSVARGGGSLGQSPDVAALPTPGAERSRGSMRRATAIDAFAEGMRSDLRNRAAELLRGAEKTSHMCDRSFVLVAEAEREFKANTASVGERLRSLSAEAAARQRALERVGAEVDLYAASELTIAGQLLDRLGRTGEGPDPLPLLRSVIESVLKTGSGPALDLWLSRAAPLAGLTLVKPGVGDSISPELHEVADGPGPRVATVLAPGALREDGTVAIRARVLTGRGAEAEEAHLAEAEMVSEPPHAEVAPVAEVAPLEGEHAAEHLPEAEEVVEAEPVAEEEAAANANADANANANADASANADALPTHESAAPPGVDGAWPSTLRHADASANAEIAVTAAVSPSPSADAPAPPEDAVPEAPPPPPEALTDKTTESAPLDVAILGALQTNAPSAPAGEFDEVALAAQVAEAVALTSDSTWSQASNPPPVAGQDAPAAAEAEGEVEVLGEAVSVPPPAPDDADADAGEAAPAISQPPAPPPDDDAPADADAPDRKLLAAHVPSPAEDAAVAPTPTAD